MRREYQPAIALAEYGPLLKILFVSILLALSVAAPALAQQFSFPTGAARPLDPDEAFRLNLRGIKDGRAEIGWDIAEGYYLYRDQLSATDAAGASLPIETPPGVIKDDPNFGTVEVYYDGLTVYLPQAGGEIALTWQGCQEDGICYAPVTRTLALPPLSGDMQPAPPAAAMQVETGGGLIAGLAGRGGTALVLAAFFGFGLALALTPCVFPMVPILAGMLARQGESLTPARGTVLSGTYVVAMASAFAVLGAVAGWSGRNLQMVLQSPWVIGATALLFVALALSSFGLFDLRLPERLTSRLAGGAGKRGTIGGAAALGFTSALIVGPCVTAPLAGAFLYIAYSGDVMLGAAALFMLGLGQGAPLVVAGTIGARVLPRAGGWMERGRQFFGTVFLALAIWLAGRVLPSGVVMALWAVLLAGVGVFLGAFDRLGSGAGTTRRLGRTAGVIVLFWAAMMGVGVAVGADDPLRPLAPLASRDAGEPPREALAFADVTSTDELQAALASEPGRPSMIYVTADWCTTCKGIEHSVLPDADVMQSLQDVRLLQADVTRLDAEGQALLDRLGAAGPPTMIFLDTALQEVPGTRLIGTIPAADVVRAAASTAEAG